ncbi:MAG: metalloregulator ArsR/SmtB family transcription factor [Thermoanaerobaculia bacterium]|nr:metalloregulator ArsR/SmtB family transcription factor [Thermoanaerobaculia bacterium]
MTKPAILDRMQVLSDPMRSRLLAVLDRAELTVSELCDVVQAPQSTVSRHLRVLADDGWIEARREGTNRHYSMTERLDEEAGRLWEVVGGELRDAPFGEHDAMRLASVLRRRRERSRDFFDRTAGEWDELRQELYGETAELSAALALLDDGWTVGDLGCGTGRVADRLAPWIARLVAVDASRSMLDEARRRLARHDNVDLRRGDLEELPLEDGELDTALLVLVLHHLPQPEVVLAEVRRVLKPGGRLVILDMVPHDRTEYRSQMGHLWLGFEEEELAGWLEAAGLEAARYSVLPPDPAARGPMLFVATARRPDSGGNGASEEPSEAIEERSG